MIFSLFIILSATLFFQDNCEVKIAALRGSYEGECKKGFANGKGIAKGIDSYNGEFKKGYPNGSGLYTWANGDIYEGAWKNGLKEGAGKFIVAGDTLEGFWIEDYYIGKEKFAYKVIHKTHNIGYIVFIRLAGAGGENRIDIRYEKETKPIRHENISVIVHQGTYNPRIIQTDFQKTLEDVEYPFQADISGEFEFVINQPGWWEIVVAMIPTRN